MNVENFCQLFLVFILKLYDFVGNPSIFNL